MRLELEQSSCRLSKVIRAAPRASHTVVNLEKLEREVAIAAVAEALLPAEQDVLVLAVGNGRLDVGASWDVSASGDVAVVEQASHGLLEVAF